MEQKRLRVELEAGVERGDRGGGGRSCVRQLDTYMTTLIRASNTGGLM